MHCCGGERFLSPYLPLQPTVSLHLSFLFPFFLLYPALLFRHFLVKLTSIGRPCVYGRGRFCRKLQIERINTSSFSVCDIVLNVNTGNTFSSISSYIHDREEDISSPLSPRSAAAKTRAFFRAAAAAAVRLQVTC